MEGQVKLPCLLGWFPSTCRRGQCLCPQPMANGRYFYIFLSHRRNPAESTGGDVRGVGGRRAKLTEAA